jgi:hypothetical protein
MTRWILAWLLPASVALADSPVSHWDFNGALADAAGAARDTLDATSGKVRYVTASEVAGVDGRAVALGVQHGDAHFLRAPSSADVRLGPDYTIEAWICPTRVGGWNRLVLSWGKQYAYHLAIHKGVLSLYHGQADGTLRFAEGGSIRAGRWYHVAGVARRDAKRLEVYLDGKLAASAPYDGTIRVLPGEGLGIGDNAAGGGTSNRFHGFVDDLTLWNRALDPGTIAGHHARRAGSLPEAVAVPVAAEAPPPMPATGAAAAAAADWKALGVREIVFCERHPGRDTQRHYYANFGYSCVKPDYWLHGADGGRLCRLDLETGAVTTILEDPGGAIRDPQVHYDAGRILFAYRKGGTHHYHLYDIGVDGTGLRQLTDGPWDDVEPTWLPDGGILFASTRCKRYILCWVAQAATLHRCDADGRNIRMLSSNTVTENTPAVLPDGRVIYTRWEYVNRDPVVFHHLWTMSPDGTNQRAYFGNMHPGGVFIDARPIPGTDRVVFISSPGHGRNEHCGNVAVVSDRNGPDDRSAVRVLTRGGKDRDPCPLSASVFLVARGNQLLLLDAAGGTRVLYTGRMMVHEPVPLRTRRRERIIPSQLDPARKTGTVVLSNVYLGRNMDGVRKGSIKKLLILEDLPKPANFHGGGSQPLGHGVTSTLKRILGTVPVEADGSAHFEVPAMRSLYLAILDGQDRSVKQMRSFMTLQAGESFTCVGCHEPRTQTPTSLEALSTLQALKRPASRIAAFRDIPDILDYPRDVQPVLDRHCIRCHNPKDREGHVVLTGDRGPVFSHSYYELFFQWQIKDTGGNPGDRSGRQNGNDRPHTTYSSASPLMKKIDGSHYEVKLDERERTLVRLWLDVSAQYPGTVAAVGTGQIGGCWGDNKYVREMAQKWPSTGPAAEAVSRRCAPCHGNGLPRHVTDTLKGLSYADMLSWERPLSRFSRHRIFNLSRPDKSLVLMAPLAREAGGYAEGEPRTVAIKENRRAAPKPVTHPVIFKITDDPDYRKILAHVTAAGARLEEIKRFDMPGFRPNAHYVREMKRYGILPPSFDVTKDAIDVYETDRKYWASFYVE